MNDLDQAYAQLLHLGFLVLRQAVDAGDAEWVRSEVELLHNVPSLLGEENMERHRYFWIEERGRYIEWVTRSGSDEAKSRMRTYYEPAWNELEPVFAERLQLAGRDS